MLCGPTRYRTAQYHRRANVSALSNHLVVLFLNSLFHYHTILNTVILLLLFCAFIYCPYFNLQLLSAHWPAPRTNINKKRLY